MIARVALHRSAHEVLYLPARHGPTGTISKRTRAALAAAKARGTKLGGLRPGTLVRAEATKANADAMKLMVVIGPLKAAGQNLSQIAATLDGMGVATPRGGKWTAMQVKRTLERAG